MTAVPRSITCLAAAVASFCYTATVLAEDAPPKTDQPTFQEKLDDVRKAIQNDRDHSSPIVPGQQVIDPCKINPQLPQCKTQ